MTAAAQKTPAKQTLEKLHFLYEQGKEPASSFGAGLAAALGQWPLEKADAIVCIGGDGLLLQALRKAGGKPVYGLTPPGSNSQGFWMDHGVETAAQLKDKLQQAEIVPLVPLEAEVRFTSGQSVLCHAFNSVAVERASGQAALMQFSAQLGRETVGPVRIMGDGFIFSTALGSTGLNRSYGGPAADIHNNVIILTGKGIYQPRGLAPVVSSADRAVLKVDFASVAHKRPVRVDYDGLSVQPPEGGGLVEHVTVRAAPEKAAKLLVTKEPGLRAYSVFLTPAAGG